jgi:hypothetical protein
VGLNVLTQNPAFELMNMNFDVLNQWMLDAQMNQLMVEASYCFHLNGLQQMVDGAFFAFDLNDAHVIGIGMPVDHLLHHFHLNLVQRHQNVNVELYG